MIQRNPLPRNLRTRVFLPVFVLSCLVSLAYVFLRPAVYVSNARLQIETPEGPRQSTGPGPGQGTSPSQSTGGENLPNLLIAAQALTSNEVLDKVTQRLGGPDTVSLDALRGMLSATPVPGTNVIELRAEGGRRELLPQVLAAWLEAYRESQSDAYGQSSTVALESARGSVEQLKQEIAAKRQELEQFRRKSNIVSLERDENQAASRMKGLNTALNEARNREVNVESRLKAMRENVAAGRTATGASDRRIVVELEKRASDLRDRIKDLEQEYTPQYLALDPKYKALRANLARSEQQIEQEKSASVKQALHDAEEELAGARQAVLRLQDELSARKREVQEFTARFSEHASLANQLAQLEGTYDAERQRLALLEKAKKGVGPKFTVLSLPTVPDRPDRPDYWRDALFGVAGSAALGLLAVWFVEFFLRSGVPRPEPASQPVIHINYPPLGVLDAAVPVIGGTVHRLPETFAPFPRELSPPEVRALWAAAVPDARLVIAGLLGGLSLDELAALRYEEIDFDADSARLRGAAGRNCTLRDPLRRLLVERRSAQGGDAPLAGAQGAPLSSVDLEGLVACAACDAGLSNPAEVTAEALRHTYLAYLIRQGARLAEIGEFVGGIAPAAFREYGRLSPPGPGLPLEQIEPVFPALRGPAA